MSELRELACTLYATGEYASRDEAERVARTKLELADLKRRKANEEKPEAKLVDAGHPTPG